MKPQREIISGDPGARWVNETEKVKYQFVCSLINTCGMCLQYHLKIGPIWGIEMHFGCRCEQKKISPGAEALYEFADYRKILDEMSHADQVAAIGALNYRLLKQGVVKWEDIVTPNRVRDLREVVANKRLSVKTMVDAGVSPRIAEVAHSTVNTPAAKLAEQKQMEIVAHARQAGIHLNDLTEQLGKTIAKRVTIGAGPDSYGSGPAWKGGPVAPPSWSGPSHAAELAALLSRSTPIQPKAKPPKPKPEEKPSDATQEMKSPTWKPTMSAAEAEAWGRDSVIKDELTHVTTAGSAHAIEKEGFRLDVAEKMGRIWGNGVYLGLGKESAEYYKEWVKDARTLKMRVNVKKVLEFDATGENPTATQALDLLVGRIGKRDVFDRLVKEFDARNDAIMKEFRAVKRTDPKAYRGEVGDKWLADHGYINDNHERDRRIFMDIIKGDGYDAVRVTQKASAGVGGSQLIVLDPRKVVVVRE